VREQGIQAYMAALRGARRHSDFLIERARALFPARSPEAKVKALNFLLPHIRRMPNRIHRDEFANDAAQKLGIDSAMMRQELKQAAAQRVESVRAHRHDPISETERMLLRALVLSDDDPARRLAADQSSARPEWIADLPTADLLETLANAPAPANPLDAATSDELRTQLAMTLEHPAEPNDPAVALAVENALYGLETRRLERRQRELRNQIAEADRRGDQDMLTQFAMEKLQVDKLLRQR
jgi:DNA primase